MVHLLALPDGGEDVEGGQMSLSCLEGMCPEDEAGGRGYGGLEATGLSPDPSHLVISPVSIITRLPFGTRLRHLPLPHYYSYT